MTDLSAEDYLRHVVEKRANPFLSMVILGLQGSGKTNIVRWIANILDDWHVGYVFPSMVSSPRDLIDDVVVLIDSCEGKKMMLVVDDISFCTDPLSREQPQSC
jgi:hypothetical protein